MNVASRPEIFAWKPACWLRVSGSDAAGFLQGQFTNDLRNLGGEARYGLWLNVKGKVLADSFVLRGAAPDEFWIGSYHSPAAVVRERLERHVIADDVVIEDQTSAWSGWALFGTEVPEETRGGFVFAGRRAAAPNLEWVVPEPQARAARAHWLELNPDAVELEDAEIVRRRIEAAIPAIPAELGAADLPNEAGLEDVALSYTKGCYLGQEVMARLRSMGQVRRRLMRVASCDRPPAGLAVPAVLHGGGRAVGELRTIAEGRTGGAIGLAMLTLLHLRPGMQLSLSPAGESPHFAVEDGA